MADLQSTRTAILSPPQVDTMRLEWIEDILAVADAGSFHAAADTRLLTPSAFTRRIRHIETSLGCELFDRSKKPVTLRRHVHEHLQDLREAATLMRSTRQFLSDPRSHETRQITIICQHALASSCAPYLLNKASSLQLPHVRFHVGRKSDCLLELIRGDADFALVYEELGVPADIHTQHCRRIDLGKENFLLVICTELLKTLGAEGNPERLPTITFPRSIFLGEMLDQALDRDARDIPELEPVAETGLSFAVLEFVRNGIGVGWLPEPMVNNEVKNGKIVSLEHLLPTFELNVALLRLAGDVKDFIERFWQAMEKHDVQVALR